MKTNNSDNNDFDFNDLNFNVDFGNFNPEEIETDETINAVFVIDTSPSITTYVNELNYAFNDFVESMQKSHVAERLFVSVIEFNQTIKVVSGFQPVSFIPKMDFSKSIKGCTSLYDGTLTGLKNAISYRTNLENSGVKTKTLLFVITDGEDNNSKNPPHVIKNMISGIKNNERNAFSFTSILFGVGDRQYFEGAQKDMGIDHLATVGTSGDDMKRMIGFISQSISSVSSGQRVPVPDF